MVGGEWSGVTEGAKGHAMMTRCLTKLWGMFEGGGEEKGGYGDGGGGGGGGGGVATSPSAAPSHSPVYPPPMVDCRRRPVPSAMSLPATTPPLTTVKPGATNRWRTGWGDKTAHRSTGHAKPMARDGRGRRGRAGPGARGGGPGGGGWEGRARGRGQGAGPGVPGAIGSNQPPCWMFMPPAWMLRPPWCHVVVPSPKMSNRTMPSARMSINRKLGSGGWHTTGAPREQHTDKEAHDVGLPTTGGGGAKAKDPQKTQGSRVCFV